MSTSVDDLILDLLQWLESTPRQYSDVMEGWRTSCPRLPVWEEANDRGFIERRSLDGHGTVVTASAVGIKYLCEQRPQMWVTP
jgi:hypothetical protein